MSREVPVLRKMRLKALHKKNLIKAKKIIVDSITDQVIPQVSSLKTPKMFDSLIKLFEYKDLNQNMALRKQLKNEKKKMGAIEDQALTIQRRSLKRRGI